MKKECLILTGHFSEVKVSVISLSIFMSICLLQLKPHSHTKYDSVRLLQILLVAPVHDLLPSAVVTYRIKPSNPVLSITQGPI